MVATLFWKECLEQGDAMRVARLTESGKRACYHVMSRIVDRQMVMGTEEKEKFRKLMRAVEAFSGVQVLTYAILDNLSISCSKSLSHNL